MSESASDQPAAVFHDARFGSRLCENVFYFPDVARFVDRIFRLAQLTGYWCLNALHGSFGRILPIRGVSSSNTGQNLVDTCLCSHHRGDQRTDAHEVDDALEIIGQHMQRQFGADVLQCLHLEMGIAHPAFDSAKGLLYGFTPLPHLFGVLVKPPLDLIENIFVFPAYDPAFLARCALALDGAVLTDIDPVFKAIRE